MSRLPAPLLELRACRIDADGRHVRDDIVAEEVPVALVYNQRSYAVMMATPQDLEDLALGFSLSEGIISQADELQALSLQQGGDGVELQMRVPQARYEALLQRSRSMVARSGCGLCGADSLATAIRPIRSLDDPPAVSLAALRLAFAKLADSQVLNQRCHGLHAAGYAHPSGLLVREDVGRHNALDKVIGARARAGLQGGFLVITSRASYELVHKAAEAGIGFIAAISAPSALAIRLAQQAGITLAAFVRADSLSVYTHAGRLES